LGFAVGRVSISFDILKDKEGYRFQSFLHFPSPLRPKEEEGKWV
jgi:hypothetical protein